MSKELITKDFIFKTNKKGKLNFIGDFEGLYKNDPDPWGQKGKDKRLSNYYKYSRKNLIKNIKNITNPLDNIKILEIGCGFGYVSDILKKAFPKAEITGMDISNTAIKKAKDLFPYLNFIIGDICSKKLQVNKKFDVIIMNQILWFVLEKFPEAFRNFNKIMEKNGHLIFVHAFLRKQRYGKNIVDGFNGLVKYVLIKHEEYTLIRAEANYSEEFLHYDGILVLKKEK